MTDEVRYLLSKLLISGTWVAALGLVAWFLTRRTPAASSDAPIGECNDADATKEREIDDLDRQLADLASMIDETGAFRRYAKLIAQRADRSVAQRIVSRLHSPPPERPGFGFEERGLGGWLVAWQFACFEVLYSIGKDALPEIRSVAFGEYDWTQGNAIEILCRLAADGVDRERTVADLKSAIPTMRDTALLYAARPLTHQAPANASLQAIIKELRVFSGCKRSARSRANTN